MHPSRGTAVRVLFVLVLCFAAPAWSGDSDGALLVSPGSPILDGLQTMSVGSDVSTLFEAREIFRLAHRGDAVAAIDRHLARVDWAGADRAGVERARQWLRSIGCERRGTCKESEARGFPRDPKLLVPLAAAAAGIAVGLFFGMMRQFRIRSALGATLVLIVLLGYGVLVVPPYLAALLLTPALMKRWRPDRAPEAAVRAAVE